MKVDGKFVPKNKIILTEDQIRFVKDNFRNMTNRQLADAVGVKLTALRMKMYAMGVNKMKMEYWTEEQINILVNNYHYIGDKEMAEIFNENFYKEKSWSRKHIQKKRSQMNLHRTVEMLRVIKDREIAKGTYLVGNHKMWKNRGANPIGTIVCWKGVKHIKTEQGYRNYNRVLWESHNGEIPQGMNVIRINNFLPWTIDNMQLVTDAELARRNAVIRNNYPENLKNLIKIKNKLSKKIKRYEQIETN